MNTTHLNLPYLFMSQAQKEVTHNLALAMMDLLIVPIVEQIANNSSTCVADNRMYLVGTSPTGAFVGHNNQLALLIGGAFYFVTPRTHMRIYLASDSGNPKKWNGTAWVAG